MTSVPNDHLNGAPKYNYSTLNIVEKQRADPNSDGFICKRPISTEDRLILIFEPTQCCGNVGNGFIDSDTKMVPTPLAQNGVTLIEWNEFIIRYQSHVKIHQTSLLCTVISIISLIGLPTLCWTQGRYHAALHVWLDDLNRKVLIPKHMYAKFQTNAYHTKDYHEEISWLAIALNEDESRKLENEPIFWGPGCCNDKIVPSCCPDSCATCCCVPRVL